MRIFFHAGIKAINLVQIKQDTITSLTEDVRAECDNLNISFINNLVLLMVAVVHET